MFQPNSIILLMTITRSQKILILCFRGFSNFMTFMHVFLLLLFFFLQDIYYANNKELIKKKLLTKFQTTLITEGEKKGKVLHDTYNYLHFTIIFVTAKKQPRNSWKVAYFTNSYYFFNSYVDKREINTYDLYMSSLLQYVDRQRSLIALSSSSSIWYLEVKTAQYFSHLLNEAFISTLNLFTDAPPLVTNFSTIPV